MELVVATGNQGKLREIRRLCADRGIEVLGLDAFPGAPVVEEDGTTFAENAVKKAASLARFCGRLTLADDSGLTVAALNGAPGVHSARYAGDPSDDGANNRKLLDALQGIAANDRGGAFCCVIAVCEPDGMCHTFEGRLEGLLLEAPRGEGGFGYDPLFLVREYGKTLAELPLEMKNRISHRGQALGQVLDWLDRKRRVPVAR